MRRIFCWFETKNKFKCRCLCTKSGVVCRRVKTPRSARFWEKRGSCHEASFMGFQWISPLFLHYWCVVVSLWNPINNCHVDFNGILKSLQHFLGLVRDDHAINFQHAINQGFYPLGFKLIFLPCLLLKVLVHPPGDTHKPFATEKCLNCRCIVHTTEICNKMIFVSSALESTVLCWLLIKWDEKLLDSPLHFHPPFQSSTLRQVHSWDTNTTPKKISQQKKGWYTRDVKIVTYVEAFQ